MEVFNWLSYLLGFNIDSTTSDTSAFDSGGTLAGDSLTLDDNEINPATGLPMIAGIGGIDVGGNTYGTDFSSDLMSSSFDDSWA